MASRTTKGTTTATSSKIKAAARKPKVDDNNKKKVAGKEKPAKKGAAEPVNGEEDEEEMEDVPEPKVFNAEGRVKFLYLETRPILENGLEVCLYFQMVSSWSEMNSLLYRAEGLHKHLTSSLYSESAKQETVLKLHSPISRPTLLSRPTLNTVPYQFFVFFS